MVLARRHSSKIGLVFICYGDFTYSPNKQNGRTPFRLTVREFRIGSKCGKPYSRISNYTQIMMIYFSVAKHVNHRQRNDIVVVMYLQSRPYRAGGRARTVEGRARRLSLR